MNAAAVMSSSELVRLVEERLLVLEQISEMTHLQAEAIAQGRMSQLMQLLQQKQGPLRRLNELSKQLGAQVDTNPEARHWTSEAARQACREKHQRCEEMLLDLMARERSCEESLQASQRHLQTQLDGVHEKGRVLKSYAGSSGNALSGPTGSTGGRLDLASD